MGIIGMTNIGIVSGEVYNIGQGQEYETIASFAGWTELLPGDHVRIHPGTYKELIVLMQSGTEENPIVIEGVPDTEGNLPVLDGDGAIVPAQFDPHLSHYDIGGGSIAQGYGMIFIHGSLRDDPYGWGPEHIVIKNLELRSAIGEFYSFTNSEGNVQFYPGASSGIYIKTGNNILVENCVIHDNGNGLDIQGVDSMVHNVTVRGCHIYGNGRTDGRFDREHNVYTEASGVVFEYNLIGPIRQGSGGSALKDRSADTVIRYNVIYSGARTLDLVEPENQAGSIDCDGTGDRTGSMHAEPGFNETWVYGNVFINTAQDGNTFSANMFHYGADNCPAASRSGTLYFYNNLIYTDISQGERWYIRLFDPTSNRESIEFYNNAFVNVGTTNVYMGNSAGVFNWRGGNFIGGDYYDLRDGSSGVWNEEVGIIEGGVSGVINNPILNNFLIPNESALIGAGVPLPLEITSRHDVDRYYEDRGYVLRSSFSDIGAFESGVEVPACEVNWSCSSWGECLGGFENRSCVDLAGCGVLDGRPEERRVCGEVVCHVADLSDPCDGVDTEELIVYIGFWESGGVSIGDVMGAVSAWRS